MAEMDHWSKLLTMLSIAALIVVGFEVSADQHGRPLQRYRNDNDDDDMTFSGDIDGSGGSGLEPSDNENNMANNLATENCSQKNKSACLSQQQRRSTLVPVYGTATGRHIVTQKLTSEASVTPSYRSLMFSPVRSTAMTSSRLQSRDKPSVHSNVSSTEEQIPCISASSRDDCIITSGSVEDDDIEIVEETSEIVGNETKSYEEENVNNPDDRVRPVEAIDNKQGPFTTTMIATSSGPHLIKYSTKALNNQTSAIKTTLIVQLHSTSDTNQQQFVSVDDVTTVDTGSRPVKAELPNQPEVMLDTEPPTFVDYNNVVTRYEIDSRLTTNHVRVFPIGFQTPDGPAIQWHASSERYAALVLNVVLLTGIALLLVLFIVVLACLILYRRRRTRCRTNDVIATPPIVTSSCNHSGMTSPSSHQPTTVHTRMMIDARRPPAYQAHREDDQRLFEVASCHNSVTGSRAKVGGDPREWFV